MQELTDEVINAFRFLSDEVLVVANNPEFEASPDLFTLPKPHDKGRTPMMKVAKLFLPEADHSVYGLAFCNPPAKNGIPRSNRLVDNAAVSIKPFTNSPDNNIIHCSVSLTCDEDDYFSVIVHSSALLHYATPQYFKSIPWEEWNLFAWCIRDEGCKATDISGQRLLTDNEIWDFNQYRVKQLGKDFAVETETAHISVVTEISRVGVIDCDNPIYSSLPYVRIVPKRWKTACFDDDRIFTIPVSNYHFPSFLFLMIYCNSSPRQVGTSSIYISVRSWQALTFLCTWFTSS
jgi:hypothetical protein